MKTLTVKREGTSTEFSYEIVWDGSYERLAGCVENLKLPAKKACIVTDSTVSELLPNKKTRVNVYEIKQLPTEAQ